MYYMSEINNLSELKIDDRCKEFGDSFLIILDIAEFFKRVEEAADLMKRKLLYGPVTYEDVHSYRGKWSLFKKPVTYKYQNEFRFLIKQTEFVGPIMLKIGPLHGIAVMLESECIGRLNVMERRKDV